MRKIRLRNDFEKGAKRLMSIIKDKQNNWNEVSMIKIGGYKFSQSDIAGLTLYLEVALEYKEPSMFMMGDLRDLLLEYGVIEEVNGLC